MIVWEARTSKELARVELPGVVRFVEWENCDGGDISLHGDALPSERFVACHNKFASHPAALAVFRFNGHIIEELMRISTLPTPANQVKWGIRDELLVSGHENGEFVFWRADTGAEVKRVQAHEGPIIKFDFNQHRDIVATASHDKQVKVWDLGESGADMSLKYHATTDRPLNAVAIGPLSRDAIAAPLSEQGASIAIIAAGGQDARDVAKTSSDSEQFGTLMFRLGVAEALPAQLQADGVTKGHFGPVHTLAFSRDGGAIASGSEDGCVRFHIFDPSASPPAVQQFGTDVS